MPVSKRPGETVTATRYYKLTPKFNQAGNTVIGLDVSNGTVTEPDWSTGPFVKVTFKVAKDIFKPLAEVEIFLDERNVATPDVIMADLKELKESLE